ncbi:MAG: glycerate kinase [Pyramidobacter sp.]
MKILIAPDSFKGCCTAAQAARYMASGAAAVYPDAEIAELPAADGGEGTVEALSAALGGTIEHLTVRGPQGSPADSFFGILPGRRCAIEMAAASGLTLIPRSQLNPLTADSFGTGELIRAGLDAGCRDFIIGIGGSATNDGGAGMARALGVKFTDRDGHSLPPGGAALARLEHIDISGLDPRIRESRFTAACDVTNLLCGPAGASAVYGPQKGATPEMVRILDSALAHYAEAVRRDLGRDILTEKGYGAAGGLGAGLAVFCGAEIRSGINTILDLIGFDRHVKDSSLVITGEGSIDGQSVYGKVPVGIAARTKKQKDIPVAAIVGNMKPDAAKVYKYGIDVICPAATGPMSLDESIRRAPELLSGAAERLMRTIHMAQKMGK